MKKISLQKNNLIDILVFLVIISLLGGIIFYLFRDIQKESSLLSLQKKKIVSLEKERIYFSSLKKKYEKDLPDLLKIKSLFVSLDDPLPFVQFLEKISSQEEVSLKIESSSQEKKEEALLFAVSTVSSYPQFFKFLTKLEKGPYLLKIDNLDIKVLKEEDLKKEEFSSFKVGDVTGKLMIKVYSSL